MIYLLAAAMLFGLAQADTALLKTAEGVTTDEIAAHIRFLSDDLVEGRGIGARGGYLAELYIETMYRHYGLEPAFGESYRQEVTLQGATPDPETVLEFIAPGGEKSSFDFGEDFVAVYPFPRSEKTLEAELVYVGYGIVAPGYEWDDYKDTDVRGKIVVIQVNEPRPDLPELFEGRTLTYFGRWIYKYQEAARQGAAGALLIHSTEDAGYSWSVVRNSWAGEAFFVPGTPDVLPLRSWLSGGTALKLMAMAGKDLAAQRAAAQERSFQPVPLGVRVRITADNKYRKVISHNIVGVARGKAPAQSAKAVVFSAHHDHFGIGEGEGDQIYNGALDNGSALAALLAMARVCGENQGTLSHDVVFLACAAEEELMLGSDYFVRNPSLPAERIVANLNFEMTNVWGEADDMLAIGAQYSDLQELIEGVAAGHGMTVSPESAPEQGYFYRSDQVSFARAGIPATWIDLGEKLRGRPEGYGKKLRDDYRANCYHQVTDEFDPEWELTGTQQIIRLCTELLLAIDRRAEPIRWKEHSPFRR